MAMCYPYCRFSSAGQEGNDSIRRQEELLTQWMQRHPEHTLSPLKLRDLKMSSFRGKNIKSGDLGKFIALVKKENSPIEKNAILVIENLDRFSRLPPRQSLQHFNELINYGITIQTLSPEMEITADNIDNNNMLFPVICTLQRAHEESKIKSARVKSYWANLRKDNKFDQGHLPA
ncbi:MAG: recombinase family protein, partial [Thermoguttaceae bacterium]